MTTVHIPATASQSLGRARGLLAKFAEWRQRAHSYAARWAMHDESRNSPMPAFTSSDIALAFDAAFAASRWVGQDHIG